jgi:hypothetical protein
MKQMQMKFLVIIFITITFSCSKNYLKRKQDDLSDKKEEENDYKQQGQAYKGHCFVKIKNFFYDLNTLTSKNGYLLKTINNLTLSFNFCRDIITQCEATTGLLVSTNRCSKLAGNQKIEKTFEISVDEKKNQILTVTLPTGDTCEKTRTGTIPYSTVFQFTCDESSEALLTNDGTFDPKSCQNTVKFRSRLGKNL